MKTIMKNTLKTVLAVSVFFMASTATAQTGKTWTSRQANTGGSTRMEKDIRVTEDILKNILSEARDNSSFGRSNVKGFYLEGKGVVFLIPFSQRSFSGDRAAAARNSYNSVVESLYEFYVDYAGVIKQLDPTESVSVISTLNGGDRYDVFYGELNSFSISADGYFSSTSSASSKNNKKDKFVSVPFVMSAKKSDIDKARTGSISDAAFKKLVSFETIGGKNSYVSERMMKDIKIFNNVLSTTFEEEFGNSYSSSKAQGTYIKDYGVLFTVPISNISISWITSDEVPDVAISVVDVVESVRAPRVVVLSDLEKALDKKVVELKKKQSSLKNDQDRLSAKERATLAYEDIIVSGVRGKKLSNEEYMKKVVGIFAETLGDYGRTMRELKPTDKISLLYKAQSYGRSGKNSNMMVTVDFKDVQAYAKGSMSLESLKGKIKAQLFE